MQITSGAQAGEMVIVAGNLNLKDGAEVQLGKASRKVKPAAARKVESAGTPKMEQLLFQDKYPVRLRRYDKKKLRVSTLDELCQYFREMVERHSSARYIDTFDHYAHTTGLSDGVIDSSIVGAKHVMFCFGERLKNPEVLSVRPRSIGICETESQFVISFLAPPSATATATMEQWVCGLAKPASTVEHKRAEGGQAE